MPSMNWLLHTDAGLFARITVGIAILLALAIADLHKNGRAATRWREYGFLLICVAVAMLYGAMNDQFTSTISWEYFYYGKELEGVLGTQTPPDALRLHVEAAKVGMKATWTAGLIAGVALLIANNPSRHWPQLNRSRIARRLPAIFIVLIAFAIIGGFAGSQGWLTNLAQDFKDMVAADVFRPYRFMAAWGVHLGAYLGGVVGTVLACMSVVRERKRLTLAPPPAP